MRCKLYAILIIAVSSMIGAAPLRADDPTSRFFPLAPLASSLAPSTTGTAVQFEVWDDATAGTMIFAEAHTVDTDAGSRITNDTGLTDLLLGRGTPGGLAPVNFPASSTRYLDVTQGGATVLTARLPLYGSVFSISPPSEVPGNLTLPDSSATAGNIVKDGVLFLHNFGFGNAFLGGNAGNLYMTGSYNTGTGTDTLTFNTTGSNNTANGYHVLFNNTGGSDNTANGYQALFSNTSGYNDTVSGSRALFMNTTGSYNSASGYQALYSNCSPTTPCSGTQGFYNTASGSEALFSNTSGSNNTALGTGALSNNTTGSGNTAIGYLADVSLRNLTNATAIGYLATVDASNKIRFGDTSVSVIEGQVPYTFTSDKNQKENFQPVNAEDVLTKLAQLPVSTWNYIGHDPKQFRHYGPVAQDFFAAFGHDGVGTIGTNTTINSGDMEGILMIAVQALEKRTSELATLKA